MHTPYQYIKYEFLVKQTNNYPSYHVVFLHLEVMNNGSINVGELL